MTGIATTKPIDEAAPAKNYFHEIRINWRALAAASAGLGAGNLLNHYISAIFAPHLLAEFGWAKADFAMIGALNLIVLLFIPIVGRMTDLFGVRPVATVGVVALPLVFVAMSLMTGSMWMFAVITLFQFIVAGTTTTSTVYSRLLAERFVTARGLAFAIGATTPALIGIIGSPLLHIVIDDHGWRVGYLAVAGYVAIVGALALVLIPPDKTKKEKTAASRSAGADYGKILRARPFQIIFGGMLFCNLIFPMQSSQLALMLAENGAGENAVWMISLFAAGVMLGRIICGIALDRYPSHVVALVTMGVPGLALIAVALGFNTVPMLAASVFLMGFSLGAESDLAAYLVIRFFPIQIYSSVLSLVVVAIAVSAAIGAILLGFTLKISDSFDLYMTLAGIAGLLGAGLLFMLGRCEPLEVIGESSSGQAG